MNLLRKLRNFIATVGMNGYFVTFNAHWGFSFFVLALLPYWWTVAGCLAIAAIKEFWFDARYETGQTAFDNWTDFGGYAFGLLLGALRFIVYGGKP